jgi:hypothetical protein
VFNVEAIKRGWPSKNTTKGTTRENGQAMSPHVAVAFLHRASYPSYCIMPSVISHPMISFLKRTLTVLIIIKDLLEGHLAIIVT